MGDLTLFFSDKAVLLLNSDAYLATGVFVTHYIETGCDTNSFKGTVRYPTTFPEFLKFKKIQVNPFITILPIVTDQHGELERRTTSGW